ncbi:hypothetical protein VSK92_14270 [Bacillus swezeyi]
MSSLLLNVITAAFRQADEEKKSWIIDSEDDDDMVSKDVERE